MTPLPQCIILPTMSKPYDFTKALYLTAPGAPDHLGEYWTYPEWDTYTPAQRLALTLERRWGRTATHTPNIESMQDYLDSGGLLVGPLTASIIWYVTLFGGRDGLPRSSVLAYLQSSSIRSLNGRRSRRMPGKSPAGARYYLTVALQELAVYASSPCGMVTVLPAGHVWRDEVWWLGAIRECPQDLLDRIDAGLGPFVLPQRPPPKPRPTVANGLKMPAPPRLPSLDPTPGALACLTILAAAPDATLGKADLARAMRPHRGPYTTLNACRQAIKQYVDQGWLSTAAPPRPGDQAPITPGPRAIKWAS